MTDWLPVEDLYLERGANPTVRPNRPWNQSDVFADIPLSIIARFREDTDVADPARTQRVMVMLVSHPCVLRAGAAGRPSDQQVVAEVQRAEDAQGSRPFQAPWDSHYSLFPLPDFLGGDDYVVNFRRVGTTHRRYLDDKRIGVLSHAGWAAMQRRFAYHSLRVDLPLAGRRMETAASWEELQLWEEWIASGRPPDEYQAWLNEDLSGARRYTGQPRRSVLEYAPDDVRADLP